MADATGPPPVPEPTPPGGPLGGNPLPVPLRPAPRRWRHGRTAGSLGVAGGPGPQRSGGEPVGVGPERGWEAGDDEELPPPGDTPPAIGGGGPWPAWLDALRRRAGLDHRAVAWAAAALVAAGLGLWLLRPAPGPVEEALPMAATSSLPDATASGPTSAPTGTAVDGTASGGDAAGPTSSVPADIVVHAAGAVRSPGVYTLAAGARVDELVGAAGGLAPDADASRLNLAAPLADGARLYVPRVGESEPPPVVGADGGGPAAASADAVGGGAGAGGTGPAGGGPPTLVDLNTATEEELDTLPGVGPSIAAAILAFREENGGFASVDDLLDVRGIGEARLAELRPLVTV